MKRFASLCLVCAAVAGIPTAHAANSELSRASENVGMASAIVLLGSMSMLAASGQVVVTGLETVADGSVLASPLLGTAGCHRRHPVNKLDRLVRPFQFN